MPFSFDDLTCVWVCGGVGVVGVCYCGGIFHCPDRKLFPQKEGGSLSQRIVSFDNVAH